MPPPGHPEYNINAGRDIGRAIANICLFHDDDAHEPGNQQVGQGAQARSRYDDARCRYSQDECRLSSAAVT